MGLAFGSYGWAPVGPNEVAAQLEAAKVAQPVEPVTRQWGDDGTAQVAMAEAVAALAQV